MEQEIQKKGEVILYHPSETIKLEVRLENETVWLSVEQMSLLFARDRSVIGKHIRKIFEEGELDRTEVWAKFAHTTLHGSVVGLTQTTMLDYFNLDVVISVGYRVKSIQGTLFRKWANKILKEYLIKGYVVNPQLPFIQRQIDDRFLIIDDDVYMLGNSVKDFGNAWGVVIKMEMSKGGILAMVERR